MLTLGILNSADSKRITGTLNGKAFNINFSDELFTSLNTKKDELATITEMAKFEEWSEAVDALVNGANEGDIITTACDDLMYDSKTSKYYLSVGGKVSKHPVPSALVAVILESVEKGLSADPIVKAWIRFLRNPNFTPDKAENFAAYVTATIVDTDEVDRLMDEEGILYEKAVEMATYNDVSITDEGSNLIRSAA